MKVLHIAKEWSLFGYMNLIAGCGEEGCDPHAFPVVMSDGSQRTACLLHLPIKERERGRRIIAGLESKILLDRELESIDQKLDSYPEALRNEMLASIARMIRSRSTS